MGGPNRPGKEGTTMRVRRWSGLLGIALALTLALGACGGDDEGGGEASGGASFAEGTTMARLKDAGAVTVGTKFDQPLFGLKNLEGKPEGFDVEIAKLIAGEMGIAADKVNFIESVSANREPFIQQGKVDFVVATYTINDKRKQVVDFAGPYYVAGQDIMVAKGNPEAIAGPDDLAGKKVCSVTGSTPAENIRTNYPDAKLTEFDVYSKCAEALKNGQVQAVTTDNVILLGLISQDPEAFELVGKPFTEEPYGIGLKKDDTEFRNFINDTLDKLYQDGRWKAAWEATAGKVATETPTPPTIDRY
jgi:glutamate transport system substrate-binding protein